MTQPRHFNVLDSFRGIFACIVAFSHFNANSIFYGSPLFDRGSIYVDFFFVLSGFVIFANYADRLQNGFSLKNFIFLRFARLYPLHFFVLMAFIAVDLLQMLLPVSGAALFKPFSAPGEGIGDIVANLLLIHSLNVSEHLAFNGPSWSISVEFYTYILFGIILVCLKKFQNVFIFVLGLGSAILLYNLYGELYAKLDYGFLRCFYGFSCGALTWVLYSRLSQPSLDHASTTKKFSIAEIFLFVACVIYIQFFSFDGLSMLAPIVFSGMILLYAFEGGIISRFLKMKFFLFLGMLSYSIYMTHIFISGKFFELPVRILEQRGLLDITVVKYGAKLYGQNLLTGTIMELFYLCVVILCSFITYKLVEEPCRDFSKKIVRRQVQKKEAVDVAG